jgi:hypothetical protein
LSTTREKAFSTNHFITLFIGKLEEEEYINKGTNYKE